MNDEDTKKSPESVSHYFGALAPDDLIDALSEKIDMYYRFVNTYQFMDKWKRGHMAYYGMSESGANSSRINYGGENGDMIVLKVNQFRSLLQNLLTMTTSSRPAFAPKAQNTDSKSMNQAILARSVLDYYLYEQKLDQKLKQATEYALYAAEGFISMGWNATTGNIIGVQEDGSPLYDGDLEFRTHHPIDVIRNPEITDIDSQWKIVRTFKNKYDLVTKFPDKEDEIMSYHVKLDGTTCFNTFDTDTDYVPYYTFYHEKTEALPNGRYVEFLEGQCILIDGQLPYETIPVFRISPGEWAGTAFGYSVGFDLMGMQKTYDALQSGIATNQLNNVVSNIIAPKGSNIEPSLIGQGMNFIEYNSTAGAKPEVLNLAHTDPQVFQQSQNIVQAMQTISGVNAISRGQVDKELSGAAMALVAAQAVTFNSGLQNSYNSLLESTGLGIIQILRVYCKAPRLIAIGGKSNRSRVQEFQGSSLEGIERVTVEAVNPLSKTASGRMSMAQDMLKTNLITTPQHYLEVVQTGNLEALLEHDTTHILLIRSENEDLADGKTVTALLTDTHRMHVTEHLTVLDSPEAREDDKIVQAVLAHINSHIALSKEVPPELAQLLGQPLSPTPPPAGPAPGAPPGGVMPQMANPTQPVVTQAHGVKGPSMPHLPSGTPPELQGAYQQVKTNS